MRAYFQALAALLDQSLQGAEQYKCWFAAEATDFVRFNRSAIRQSGHVRQSILTLDLIDGRRHAASVVTLAGDLEQDWALVAATISALRVQLPDLPDDPYLRLPSAVTSSEHAMAGTLPPTGEMVDQILVAAVGLDLVGILAAGPIYRGFADAAGQRNWHESATFNLDWSLYLSGTESRDKAVKSSYAGADWDGAEFRRRIDAAQANLALLARPPVNIAPGAYRAYLTPTAVNEIVGMFNWNGLSEKALRTRQSGLRRMRDEGMCLHPSITLRELTADGIAPDFQAEGFTKPDSVTLIEGGRLVGSMIAPRTATEYGLLTNGADADESMKSLDLAAGDLAMADALRQLGTGIYVSNLWYLNFSDRANCRITGMTRFATFWVENGEIVAPLNVMRFDESVYRLLGDNLLALTREREFIIANDTYLERSTASARMPGALVKDFSFVL
ncbi:MAG: TldE/PmbA family protein [Herminiimonas sp.]|nr:TldE/PmbA family protein [Herminiimonas sp.]